MNLEELSEKGFTIEENLYSEKEIIQLIECSEKYNLNEVFGLREFLLLFPEFEELIFTKKMKSFLDEHFPNHQTLIKSIYFDKPPNANWIVNWHQDITVNLSAKNDLPHFSKWRKTKERTVAQAPLSLLKDIITIRLHLDDTTKKNGALQVLNRSHQFGIIDLREWGQKNLQETICESKKGGVLIMSPLLLHSSKRTENSSRRRVIHLEFVHNRWKNKINWKEKFELTSKN